MRQFYGLCLLCFIFFAGCKMFQAGADAATAPGPGNGNSALEEFFGALPKLLTDPADPEGWGKALGLVAVFIAGFFGLKKVKGKISLPKIGSPLLPK